MNVLMIFPPVHIACDSLGMRSMPPLSIYYLSTILKYEGFNVSLIDPVYFKEHGFFTSNETAFKIVERFVSENYDAVTISANTGNWAIAKIIIDIFRNYDKEIPIIVGGLHATYFDEYVLKATSVDFVIRGEGERTLPKLLKMLGNFNELYKLKGISYKGSDGQIIRNPDIELIDEKTLNSLPGPDFSLLPNGVYNALPLETSRGCKYNCIFCSVTHKKSWRCISTESVINRVNSVKEIVNERIIGGSHIYFVDDCFSANKERAIDILNTLDNLNLNLKFGIECRVTDLLSNELYEQIPKHLLAFMQIGVECGYDEGLHLVRKGITVNQVEDCCKLISNTMSKDVSFFSFIIGFPWESKEQIKKTVHFVGHITSTYGVSCNIGWLWLCPSDLWYLRQKYNIVVTEQIFDNPFWTISKDIFSYTHPNADKQLFDEVESLIEAYQSTGAKIGYKKLLI